jgi:uncharacterized coiled-coil protein SlyX
MAEHIAEVAPSLVHEVNGVLAVGMDDKIGVLWTAIERLADKIDELTDRFDDVDPLPGRGRRYQIEG